MRIGILSYPMLFERDDGVQQQVRETIRALVQLGSQAESPVEAEVINPHATRLDEFDLIHVFSAIQGNHRLVDAAAEQGVPVVLTPLISPGWDRAGDHRLGNLTAWNVQSGYARTRRALQQASLIVALGEAEKQAIGAGFLIDGAKVRVLPNGVNPALLAADGELFRKRTGMTGPYALMAGPISPYQNQLAMARAMGALSLPLVLVGEAGERDQDYLRELRAVRGVTCLGALRQDGPMLASTYAAASVFLPPGEGQGAPLAVLDALAAGTPVLMAHDTPSSMAGAGFALLRVDWNDTDAQQRAVLRLLVSPPPREQVRALVRGCTWERVARQLAACYAEVATLRQAALG
ncbi:glycosyltransferase family 4 protein [Massilia sp. DJPM01]|uniref:glycosyltransferase family 4 protein n=1 Tax=Massilia sp. DJPM01 TaxID=3024404 RepID=UPI00259F1EA2|nr:glycosyltransferase family 4 protein [Massilia sp. DJPM01]MDM5180485.1 glycosyltransferase family 4 protein [Massilia sp. DJPM01]